MMAFGLASVLVLAVSLIAWRKDPGRFASAAGVSLMLLFSWWASNSLIALYGVPDGVRASPIIDLIGLSVMAACWAMRPKVWKAVVGLCFAACLCAHWAFLMQPTTLAFARYSAILDVIFAVQLVTAALPGGGYVLDRVISHLLDRRGFRAGLGVR